MSSSDDPLAERRNLISTIFLDLLVAVAYSEMVAPVWDSLGGAHRAATLLLFGIFFLTSIRFVIGNYVHLTGLDPALGSKVWFHDFAWLALQSLLLIAMGHVCSVEESAKGPIGFVGLLILLYSVDIGWISSQWALGRLSSPWRRPKIPWQWAILNLLLIGGIALARVGFADLYAPVSMSVLFGLSVVGFIVDVFEVDYAGLFRRRRPAAGLEHSRLMQAAIEEARQGQREGGIPIGSVLVRDGKILGRGHNRRVQQGDPVAHAEIDCLRNAGRIGGFRGTVLYSTLMPCYLCAGAIVQFGISKVVAGEAETFAGARQFMESHGVEVVDLDLQECRQLMRDFIQANPQLWNEDIGR